MVELKKGGESLSSLPCPAVLSTHSFVPRSVVMTWYLPVHQPLPEGLVAICIKELMYYVFERILYINRDGFVEIFFKTHLDFIYIAFVDWRSVFI